MLQRFQLGRGHRQLVHFLCLHLRALRRSVNLCSPSSPENFLKPDEYPGNSCTGSVLPSGVADCVAFLCRLRKKMTVAPRKKAKPKTAPNVIPTFAPTLSPAAGSLEVSVRKPACELPWSSTPIVAARAVAYAMGNFDRSLDYHMIVTGSANRVPAERTVSERYTIPPAVVSHTVWEENTGPGLYSVAVVIGARAVNGAVRVL
jgi:hypothetical protein